MTVRRKEGGWFLRPVNHVGYMRAKDSLKVCNHSVSFRDEEISRPNHFHYYYYHGYCHVICIPFNLEKRPFYINTVTNSTIVTVLSVMTLYVTSTFVTVLSVMTLSVTSTIVTVLSVMTLYVTSTIVTVLSVITL